MLEVLVGHCTYAALVRRPVLSVFHCVLRFILAERGKQVVLWWPSVVEELQVFRGLMPFLSSDWWLRWNLLASATQLRRLMDTGCRRRCGCKSRRKFDKAGPTPERDQFPRLPSSLRARPCQWTLPFWVMVPLLQKKTRTWRSEAAKTNVSGDAAKL